MVRRRNLLFSVFRVWSMKPALDSQQLVGEVNITILSILGLAQGYIVTGEQPAMRKMKQ